MDIYQASDGGLYQIDRHLEEYEALETLYEDAGNHTGISRENVLLFLEDGAEVKAQVLEEAWQQAGPSSHSGRRTKLYLFNRETFWTDAEQWAVQLQEDVQLPPPLDQSQLYNLAQVQHPFLVAHDHLSHLQSLYQAQAQSLEIAYSNLNHHLQPLIREFQNFADRAEKELQTEEDLIRGAKVDMALLPKLTINPALLRRKKDTDTEEKTKTIGDYVNPRKMEQVRDSCKTAHEEHVDRYNLLTGQLNELHLQSEAETRAFSEQSAAVGREFAESLARLEVALSHLGELLGTGVEDISQDLVELDHAMREDLISLTAVKNEFTLEIHLHLRQVAQFQSRIPQLVGPLHALDVELKDKVAFPHLHRLRQLPFAYATAVAEVVRRKEYSRLLVEWTTRLTETLSKFTSMEKKRRDLVQAEMVSQLPFPLIGMDEQGPRVDVAVVTGTEALNGINFGQAEIEKLVLWAESLKDDQDVLAVLEEGDEDHLISLQGSIESLLGKVDFASDELDKLIEQSLLSTRGKSRSASNSRMTMQLSTQLRTAHQEKAEQEKRVTELQAAHEVRMKEMEQQYEQRLSIGQTRQADLQEELVRLRTDLSEEMVARQALSAELEERSREQEDKLRDQEDQSEFIKGLQAEFTQEKDRATDLGVRLQEALLDVDGLKNAEQTLIAQVQELQEERTRSLQTLGEAQLLGQDLESQLAGVRAELEVTTTQLVEAQADRDSALRNQSAEAERLMRDHIAEADGDRAVLEHQNLTLTKQLEDVKVEMEEKITAAKNYAIRQADGLKAELSFTKAQLREVQRKETVLSDELAMAKDSATAMSQENTHQSDVARDAVALASKYHETCQRLLSAINMSTTISGAAGSQYASIIRAKSPSRLQSTGNDTGVSESTSLSTSGRDEMRESVLIRSLVTAQGFDLVIFAEAVTRTIGLVKKWSKSCRQFREQARNKISFTNFTKGDLALFLPTRNAAARSWAAFNFSAPHNFLKVTDVMQRQISTREWIIARIIKTEEAIATGGDSPTTNPFGLADGLRYYTHHVEEYDPHAVRPPRRSTSTSFIHPTDRAIDRDKNSNSAIKQVLGFPIALTSTPDPSKIRSASAMTGEAEPLADEDSLLSPTAKTPMPSRGRTGSSYFPPISASASGPSTRVSAAGANEGNGESQEVEIDSGREESSGGKAESSGSPDPELLLQADLEAVPEVKIKQAAEQEESAVTPANASVPKSEIPAREELHPTSEPIVDSPSPLPTSTSIPLPRVPASSPTISNAMPSPVSPTHTSASINAQPIPTRKTHSRLPSRGTGGGTPTSPPSRDRDSPSLAPAYSNAPSAGRPSSVASSASSYPKGRGLTLGPSGGKSALAPAMATTSSTGTATSSISLGGFNVNDRDDLQVQNLSQRTVNRKTSSSILRPEAAGTGVGELRSPSSPLGASPFGGLSRPRRGSKISSSSPFYMDEVTSDGGSGGGATKRSAATSPSSLEVGFTSANQTPFATGSTNTAKETRGSAGGVGGFAALGTGATGLIRGFTIGRAISRRSSRVTSPTPNPISTGDDETSNPTPDLNTTADAVQTHNQDSGDAIGRSNKDTKTIRPGLSGKEKDKDQESRRPSAMDMLRRFEGVSASGSGGGGGGHPT